jgi:hypothetical protein
MRHTWSMYARDSYIIFFQGIMSGYRGRLRSIQRELGMSHGRWQAGHGLRAGSSCGGLYQRRLYTGMQAASLGC